MSFPRYKQYKNSGVEWLGQVPEHWDLKRLILLASINDDALPEHTSPDFEMEYLDISSVTPGSKRLAAESMKFGGAPSRARRIVKHGDVLVSTVRTYLRAIAPIIDPPDNLIASTGFAVIRPKHECSSIFLNYALQASNFIEEVIARSTGVSYPTISAHELGFIKLPIPQQMQEQECIGQFIETEITKLDALIDLQRRLIEILKEKRQAVISDAVTKGLNANVPMKKSGIEWLGEVPAHWTMNRIRFLFRQEKRQLHADKPVLSVYRDYGVILKASRDDNMNKTPEDLSAYQLVNPNDLVVNKMKAWQGSLGVSSLEGITSPDYVVFAPTHQECSAFLHFLFRSQQMVSIYRSISNGIRPAQWRLEPDVFLGLPVFLPPSEEQRELASFIEQQTLNFDCLISETEGAIALLQERRNVIISSAVTGKIDVSAYMAKPVMNATQYSSGFAHQLLAAEILDRCNNQRMGRIKLQKLIHLCEYHAQVSELQGDYSRKAAGPFDARAMAGISKNLKKQKWFEEVKEGERYVYRPLEKRGEHKKYLAHWQSEMPRIDEVLSLLGTFKTRECEIVSTLYAAWNDLLIDGGTAEDVSILYEASSAERWHKSKEQIAPERWKKALQWMKDKGLVPVGYGKHTRHTAGQIVTTTEEAHEPA
jgi:type I restriction enzyme S subunit